MTKLKVTVQAVGENACVFYEINFATTRLFIRHLDQVIKNGGIIIHHDIYSGKDVILPAGLLNNAMITVEEVKE